METKKLITQRSLNLNGKDLVIKLPTFDQRNKSDFEYSKSYIEGLNAGLKPKILLEKEYKANGIWSDEQDLAINKLVFSLQDLFIKLETETDKNEQNKIYKDFIELKSKYEALVMERSLLFQNTVESQAEAAKLTSMLWQCIFNADDTQVWKTKEEFLQDRNFDFIQSVAKEFTLLYTGVEDQTSKLDEILSKYITPENQPSDGSDLSASA